MKCGPSTAASTEETCPNARQDDSHCARGQREKGTGEVSIKVAEEMG